MTDPLVTRVAVELYDCRKGDNRGWVASRVIGMVRAHDAELLHEMAGALAEAAGWCKAKLEPRSFGHERLLLPPAWLEKAAAAIVKYDQRFPEPPQDAQTRVET